MVLPHNIRCPVDIDKPEPVGLCDRCSNLVYLNTMQFQMQYLGNALRSLNILVCDRCWDSPSEFLRPVIIGPDPIPPKYPRPTSYAQQNEGGQPPITDVNTIAD